MNKIKWNKVTKLFSIAEDKTFATAEERNLEAAKKTLDNVKSKSYPTREIKDLKIQLCKHSIELWLHRINWNKQFNENQVFEKQWNQDHQMIQDAIEDKYSKLLN